MYSEAPTRASGENEKRQRRLVKNDLIATNTMAGNFWTPAAAKTRINERGVSNVEVVAELQHYSMPPPPVVDLTSAVTSTRTSLLVAEPATAYDATRSSSHISTTYDQITAGLLAPRLLPPSSYFSNTTAPTTTDFLEAADYQTSMGSSSALAFLLNNRHQHSIINATSAYQHPDVFSSTTISTPYQQLISLLAAPPPTSLLQTSQRFGSRMLPLRSPPIAEALSRQISMYQSIQHHIMMEGSQEPAEHSDVLRHFAALAEIAGVANTRSTRLRIPPFSADSPIFLPANVNSRALTPPHHQNQLKKDMRVVNMPMILPGGRESFPMVLHRALVQLELAEGGTSVAAFTSDGRSFQVKNQFLLEKQVLPLFFPKMKGFPSFQRQLNLYDFERIGGASIDRGTYQHASFVRDMPHLACEMKRTKIKGASRTRVRSEGGSTAESASSAENKNDQATLYSD